MESEAKQLNYAKPLRRGAEACRASRPAPLVGCFLALSACSLGGAQPVGHQAQLDVATQMIRTGQATQGYRLIDEVAERKIGSAQVRLDVADAYFKVGSLLRSESAYRTAIDEGAKVEGTVGLGRVALARNEAANARRHFETALASKPSDPAAMNGLAVSYDLDGQHATAQDIYRRIIDSDPSNLDAQNNYAMSLILDGSVQTATALLSDLAESNLDTPMSRQNLAIAYHVGGKHDAAMRLASIDSAPDAAEGLMTAVASYRTR